MCLACTRPWVLSQGCRTFYNKKSKDLLPQLLVWLLAFSPGFKGQTWCQGRGGAERETGAEGLLAIILSGSTVYRLRDSCGEGKHLPCVHTNLFLWNWSLIGHFVFYLETRLKKLHFHTLTSLLAAEKNKYVNVFHVPITSAHCSLVLYQALHSMFETNILCFTIPKH